MRHKTLKSYFPFVSLYPLFFACVLYPLQPSIKSCDELYICLSAQSQASLRHLAANAQERPQILKDWTEIQTERLSFRCTSK